jgi:hemoglobin
MRELAGIVIGLSLLVGALRAQQARPQAPPPTQEQPLYQRLGGVYPIAVVVDDFIDRVLADDVLNANPAIKAARARVPAAGLKFHVTSLVCAVTGGPCKYVGRGMQEAHAHLNITEREWQAMIGDFQVTLDKFKVPAREQGELIKIVESTKGQIVVAKASSSSR